MIKGLKIFGGIMTAFFAIVIVILIIDISNDDEQAVEQAAAEKQAEQEEKAKQEEQQKIIEDFKVKSNELVKQSNGLIPNITISEESNYFQVKVYIDETTWAQSNESEKTSFATTVGNSIKSALSPHDTYVDILSATNRDVLATQKLFGGWKIKR